MNTYQKNAVWAGILFLVGTITGFLTFPFWGSLTSPDYLAEMAPAQNQVLIGCLLVMIMGTSCAGIAIALYPVLKKAGRGMALGAVGFRLMEGVLQIVGVIIVMILLATSQEYTNATGGGTAAVEAIGRIAMAAFEWTTGVAVLIVWCIGAFLYYIIFYRSKLVPRWLSVWGLVGILMAATVAFLTMFQRIHSDDAVYFILHMPIMLQELVLAVWLIIKGFDKPALASLDNKARQAV